MHSNHYELIIDCRSTVKTLLFSLFSMSSPYKLGIEKKYNFLSDYKICTTDHESSVDIMLSLLSPIEKELNLQLTNEFVIKITEKEQRDFKNYMIQEGIDFSKPIFVCTIASRNPKKIWNTDYMAEVLLCIIKRYITGFLPLFTVGRYLLLFKQLPFHPWLMFLHNRSTVWYPYQIYFCRLKILQSAVSFFLLRIFL